MDPLQRTLDDFWQRAEPQGAVALDEPCLGIEIPPEPDSKVKTSAYTHGCTGATRIRFPYQGESGEISEATVCAVGDMAYRFPRFSGQDPVHG